MKYPCVKPWLEYHRISESKYTVDNDLAIGDWDAEPTSFSSDLVMFMQRLDGKTDPYSIDDTSVVLWFFMDEPWVGDVYFDRGELIVDSYKTPYKADDIQRICYWTTSDEAYVNFVQVRFKNGDWIRFDEYRGFGYYDAVNNRYFEDDYALKLLQKRTSVSE